MTKLIRVPFEFNRGPRISTLAIAVAVGCLLLGVAGTGFARTETVRWVDPNPDPSPVAGFKIHIGFSSGNYAAVVDLGLPPADANGIRSREAAVPGGASLYVAMSAYDDDGLESGLSNEKLWPAPPVENVPPQSAILLPSGPITVSVGQSVSFSGWANDPDNNNPLSYAWDFDGAGTSNAANPGAIQFNTAGTYDVRFHAIDAAGLADPSPATVRISVEEGAVDAPNGTITAPTKPVTIGVGESVLLSATATGGNGALSVSWIYWSGGVRTIAGANPGLVRFDDPGSFVVYLIVTDQDGRQDLSPASVAITVEAEDEPEPEPPPVGNSEFPPSGGIDVVRIAQGLVSPVHLTAPRGDPRVFIAEANGVIRVWKGGSLLPTPFIDLGLGEDGSELLSFAFDPEFARNRSFYVHYVDSDDKTVLSRFKVGANPDVADASDETVLLVADQPFDSQNGGGLAFSPIDGFLYVGMGDGGGENDPFNLSQNGASLLGKLLRLDVAVPPKPSSIPNGPYAIPADNPFVGDDAVRDEIWALGLRNPRHFSFDRDRGDLWLADEGNEQREELNFAAADDPGGRNYGWDVMEGNACGDSPAPSPACDDDSLTLPFHEYAHDDDHCSITGGIRYRGGDPDLAGDYFFADYCSGSIWSIDPTTGSGTNWTSAFEEAGGKRLQLASFGEGGGGDLFVLHENGDVFRIGMALPACNDKLDNDDDGLIDSGADPGCRNATAEIEDPLCNDGIDNDGDDMIDVLDPGCEVAWANAEDESAASSDDGGDGGGGGGGGKSCGLGFEAAILLPPLMWLRRRRAANKLVPAPELSRFRLHRS